MEEVDGSSTDATATVLTQYCNTKAQAHPPMSRHVMIAHFTCLPHLCSSVSAAAFRRPTDCSRCLVAVLSPVPFSLVVLLISLSLSLHLPSTPFRFRQGERRCRRAAGAVRGKWVGWRSGLRLRLRRLIRMLARPLALPRRPLASCLAPPPPPPGLALRHSREGKAKGREGSRRWLVCRLVT